MGYHLWMEEDVYRAADDALSGYLLRSNMAFGHLLQQAIADGDRSALAQIEGTALALSESAPSAESRVVLGGFAVLAALALDSEPANTSRVSEAFLFATEIGQSARALELLEQEAWGGNTDAIWAAGAVTNISRPKLQVVFDDLATDDALRGALSASILF